MNDASVHACVADVDFDDTLPFIHLHTDFICGFYNLYIYSYNFFPRIYIYIY